ncbi:lipase member H [Echeneis naucrates]|nr:lipase member H [Echeneis naucrates]
MFPWQYLALLLLIVVQICKAQRCDEFTDLNFGHAFIGTSIRVKLLLYTRGNGTCATLLSHTNLSAQPLLNLSRPTTFVIHGYRPTGSSPVWVNNLTELLLHREDLNVIVVDWNYGAANVNYLKAVENTQKAAANLTAFIKIMQEHGASLTSIHLIGVSLGAHMSGFVGANLNGSIGRITGLDPAGPQFTGTRPEDRLDSTDAQFVDVLHTDMDSLGFREPLGHIDFYANGGADQPGCPSTIFSGTSYFKCDHQRSVFLYLESMRQTCPIRAFPCSSYSDFLDGKCLDCDKFGAAGCPVFGYDVTQWERVLLKLGQTKTFFTTNSMSPFCITSAYRVDVIIWNRDARWGYITVKLHDKGTEAVATIDHKSTKFQKYTETRLFAQFNKDVKSVDKVSIMFSTGNVFKPKYKLRVLRVRLTHLERKDRPLCRYDIVLEEKTEVTFRPIPCEESNF